MNTEKLFPIQGGSKRGKNGIEQFPSSSIPWWLAEIAYEYYSKRFGNLQSLERLAERGGFGREELVRLLVGAGIDRFIV